MLVPLREAVQRLGLSPNTLRKYADQGIIPFMRTKSGQRRFDVDAYIGRQSRAAVICYARVSSNKQRDDLQRQIEYLKKHKPGGEVISDVGSGINYKRRGLRAILERVLRGDKLEVVVADRDRIARFGVELIEWMLQQNGGQLVVLDGDAHSPERELSEDLLAICHVFSCRMHGKRSHRNRRSTDTENTPLPDGSPEACLEALVRSLKVRVQQDGGTPTAARDQSSVEVHQDRLAAPPA
jgi:putative resolvase